MGQEVLGVRLDAVGTDAAAVLVAASAKEAGIVLFAVGFGDADAASLDAIDAGRSGRAAQLAPAVGFKLVRVAGVTYALCSAAAMERERVARFCTPNAPSGVYSGRNCKLVCRLVSYSPLAASTATRQKAGRRAPQRTRTSHTHLYCCCAHRPT